MSALLIRNLPPEVHDKLKVLAQRNRRSLSEEAARLLEQAIAAQTPLAAQAPTPFSGAFPLSDEWLDSVKNEDRA
jgi:plasmid stability protein